MASQALPVLSVIVPFFNAENTLERCISSILSQNYVEFELILIDDGSTDNSLSICEQYKDRDIRVKLFHKENGGSGSARNAGINYSSGRYITFVDADDYVSNDIYDENIRMMDDKTYISILQYPLVRIKDGKEVGKWKYANTKEVSGRENLYKGWLYRHTICNYFCNKIFRKEMFNDILFSEDMVFEDRYLMCDMLNRCKTMQLTNKGLYYYTYTEGQITSQPENDFILQSKIKADLHIVENIRHIRFLKAEYINRYYNCIAYLRRISERHVKTELLGRVKGQLPSIGRILSARVPMGIKYHLLMLHANSFRGQE